MRLIDADALGARMYYEVFGKDSADQRWDSGCWIRYRLFEKVLKETPTVESEQKTGKWIVWGGMDVPENHGRHKCSECGEFALLRYEKPLRKEILSDFCPTCGAKMKAKEDE